MDLRSQLIDGKSKLGVWGCGYIGLTSMINFAQQGIYCIGYDINPEVISSLEGGQLHIPNLDYWLGYDPIPLLDRMVQFTCDWLDMLTDDVRVHLIAVPTEKDGEPWFEPLQDVMAKITLRNPTEENPDLIVIESTLTPGMFDKIVLGRIKAMVCEVGKHLLVGIAPRRDWFDSPEKSLKALKRVIGGMNPETTQAMREVLGIVCDNLILSDAKTTELVKSVENSILHICATYACQLANAYPNVDIAEVLKLASTHWRIPLYYPSVGTGGYCIPVSSKYVKDGAEKPEYLTIIKEAIRSDNKQPIYIAGYMADKTKGGAIGILGLSYKRDLKVHKQSPSLKIIERLKELGVIVKVFDPYYTREEVRDIVDTESFDYPLGLSEFKGLVIVPPHRIFGQTPKRFLFENLTRGQVILDNEGVWEKWRIVFVANGIDYHRVGDKGWCAI